jgi:hypothetical protein
MPEVGRVEVAIVGSVQGLATALGTAQGKLRAFAGWVESQQATLSAIGMGLTALGTALAAGLGLAVKTAADFEAQMRNVNSILKTSESQFQALGQSTLDLATKTGQAPAVLARGLYDIASSGFEGAAGLKVLEASAVAATAGISDTATASRAITAVLNAYGLSADKAAWVSDILFKTVEKGVITFPQLADQIGDVISTAAQARVPLEQVGAAIAAMTVAGVQPAEAVTSLNQVLLSFIRPTDQAKKAAKDLGIDLSATALASKGLVGVIGEMSRALGMGVDDLDAMKAAGRSDAEIMAELAKRAGTTTEALAELFPNVRALRGALVLTAGGAHVFSDFVKEMAVSLGSTAAAFAEQSKSFAVSYTKIKATVQVWLVQVGSVLLPVLTNLARALTPIIKGMADWAREHPTLTKLVVGLTTAVAGLALALGPLLVALPGLEIAIPLVGKALAALRVALLSAAGAGTTFELALAAIPWLAIPALVYVLCRSLRDVRDEFYNARKAARDYSDALDEAAKKGVIEPPPPKPGLLAQLGLSLSPEQIKMAADWNAWIAAGQPVVVTGKGPGLGRRPWGAPALPPVTPTPGGMTTPVGVAPPSQAWLRERIDLQAKLTKATEEASKAQEEYNKATKPAPVAQALAANLLQRQMKIQEQINALDAQHAAVAPKTALELAQDEERLLDATVVAAGTENKRQNAIAAEVKWILATIPALEKVKGTEVYRLGLQAKLTNFYKGHEDALKAIAEKEKQRNEEARRNLEELIAARKKYQRLMVEEAPTRGAWLHEAQVLWQVIADEIAHAQMQLWLATTGSKEEFEAKTRLLALAKEYRDVSEEIANKQSVWAEAALQATHDAVGLLNRFIAAASSLQVGFQRVWVAASSLAGSIVGIKPAAAPGGLAIQPYVPAPLPPDEEDLKRQRDILGLQFDLAKGTQQEAAARRELIAAWLAEETAATSAAAAALDGSDEKLAALQREAAAHEKLSALTQKQGTLWDRLRETGQRALEQIRTSFEDAISNIIIQGGSLRDFWKTLWATLVRLAVNALTEIILKALTAKKAVASIGAGSAGGGGSWWQKALAVVSFALPFLQHGGRVRAGEPGIVGEAGPELFVPHRAGTILPHEILARLASGMTGFASAAAGGGIMTRGGALSPVSIAAGAFPVTIYAQELNERVVRDAGGIIADEVSRRLGRTERRTGV